MGLEDLITGFIERVTIEKPTICPKCNVDYTNMGLGHYQCPNCGENVTDDYGKVRDYVEACQNDVSVEKASKETGVSVERIKELVAMGKLSLSHGSADGKKDKKKDKK